MKTNQTGFFVLLVAFLLILLISGCTISPDAMNKKKTIESLGGFIGGTTGFKVGVIDGAPPTTILDKSRIPFATIITLENAGEAAVGPGTDNPLAFVRLTGVPAEHLGVEESALIQKVTSKIEPAKRNFDGTQVPGEIREVLFDNLAYTLDVFDSMAITLRAEICYDYETLATAKFCMKKDLYEAADDSSICVLKGPRLFGSSGAPLQITSVEEMPVNNSTIQINFKIEHLGNGEFFLRSPAANLDKVCTFSEMDRDIYKTEVIVEPIEKDTYELSCVRLDEKAENGGAKGVVRLYQNAPVTVTCFVKRTKDMPVRVYEDLLNIKLRYRYGTFLEMPVLVQGY